MNQDEKNALAEVLATEFTSAERAVLLHQLGVDPGKVSAAPATDELHAWECVTWFSRRRRLPELREAVERARPGLLAAALRAQAAGVTAPAAVGVASADFDMAGEWRTQSEAIDAALRLDRTSQWADVQEHTATKHDVYFLLHGEHIQDLWLFTDRIQRALARRSPPHLVVRVGHEAELALPQSPAAWETRLRDAIADRLGGPAASAPELIGRVTSGRPLVVLFELPSDSEFHDPENDGARAALAAFLAERLPRLYPRLRPPAGSVAPPTLAPRAPGHPVHVLVSVTYEAEDYARVPPLHAAMERAEREAGIHYVPLDEVQLPSRADVESFLKKQSVRGEKLRPGHAVYEGVLRAFDRLMERGRVTCFRDITALLDEKLRR